MRTHPKTTASVCALACLCLLGGCGTEQTKTHQRIVLDPKVDDPSQVVARVNDQPITTHDLRQQMRDGKDRSEALQDLIEQELLVQEAARRGIHRQPAINKLQRRAMAHRLIKQGFGDTFTKANIPDDLIDATYKRMKGYFVRPEDVKVWHYVVLASKRRTSKETQRQATALCNEIHRRATQKPITPDEFKALEKGLPPLKPPLKVKVEAFTTGEHGPAVPAFAKAAFTLQRVGQISQVTETRFGCHVIYLLERRAARNMSRSEAEPEIRDKIFVKAREEMFNRWAAKIEKGYHITVHAEALDRATKQRQPTTKNKK